MEECWIKEAQEKVYEFLGSPQQFELLSDYTKREKYMLMPGFNFFSFEKNLEFPMPTMVTIGPYYQMDKILFFPVTKEQCLLPEEEERKWLILYVMSHVYELDLKRCLEKIKTFTVDALTFHSDSRTSRVLCSEEKKFTEMLLLDSYFILFMLTSGEIRNRVTGDKLLLFRLDSSKGLEIMLDQLIVPRFADILSHKDEIMLDLLHFNNQIPFSVIEKLFKELKLEKPLHEYALEFFEKIHPRRSTQGRKNKNSPPKFSHLLHLFHWSRVPKNKYAATMLRNKLDFIDWPRYIPTAMQLRESATMFQKKTSGSSLDITFRSGRLIPIFGVLSIPRLHIYNYSSSIFHSLITFEKETPSSRNQSHRTTMAFTAFMRSLLQSEGDVKLLRRHGILTSTSMTDSEVVNFFKRLSELTGDSEMPIDLFAIYRQVQSHHNSHMSQFWGSIILQYFPNPLVTLSVFAAVILFILTLLQTIYTMLAYYYRR